MAVIDKHPNRFCADSSRFWERLRSGYSAVSRPCLAVAEAIVVLDRYEKRVYAGSMGAETAAATARKATQKQPETAGHQIAKLLLKGSTKGELLQQGFKPGTVKEWLHKLKTKGKAGILRLLQEEGIDTSDVAASASAPASQGDGGLKLATKETTLPPTFRFAVTVKLDWDTLYFYYRAKKGGYPGDISAYVNEGLRDMYQLAGHRITTVLDARKAKELAVHYLPPEVLAALSSGNTEKEGATLALSERLMEMKKAWETGEKALAEKIQGMK